EVVRMLLGVLVGGLVGVRGERMRRGMKRGRKMLWWGGKGLGEEGKTKVSGVDLGVGGRVGVVKGRWGWERMMCAVRGWVVKWGKVGMGRWLGGMEGRRGGGG
ncbi:hypothetical protein, partial [Micrococcus luteus]|uniref:hypothetical protein n=1 Tax=Micrococcus luteus TaxID=1270 RepID=UPI001C9309FD